MVQYIEACVSVFCCRGEGEARASSAELGGGSAELCCAAPYGAANEWMSGLPALGCFRRQLAWCLDDIGCSLPPSVPLHESHEDHILLDVDLAVLCFIQ